MSGWIGVDLDGTLAEYTEWKGPTHIGAPIPLMVNRVKQWIKEGVEVRIFTARVSKYNPARIEAMYAIMDWTTKVFGVMLTVTAEKDYDMLELWDDRATKVEFNTGRILSR
jgi:hypothetical protein